MTAIKKTKSKTNSSPAPATKSAAKSASRKKGAVEAKVSAPVAIAPPPAAIPAPTTPTVKTVSSKPVTTTVTARIDVGFGNALYLRGQGPGLSWDKGVLMDCVASDQWQIALPESARPYAFKFLINDTTWCTGPDYSVMSGASVTLTPAF